LRVATGTADRFPVRHGAVAGSGLALLLVLAGCGGVRIVGGVYHSPKGYRVTVPGAEWQVVERPRADLELRHTALSAGILVNASCQPDTMRRTLDVLQRQLLAGLRDRVVKDQEVVTVHGRPAVHTLLEGRLDGDAARMEIETYVVKGEPCVYDLLYAAPPGAFEQARDAFHQVVESLTVE
jgi:hypothetical protein